ncbi:rod shape-determining protein MreC [Desulfurispora thermophila]|uniref:rod shape-determining protein MreC n=1 Tax=Desulfurispora thermophila TaxID=265470 RepID=UPI0003816F64|nr:rod shape-determining protein MreC [Desulfurispora thermophila]
MKAKVPWRALVIAIILVMATLSLIRYTAPGRGGFTPLEAALRDLTAPAGSVFTRVGNSLSRVLAFPVSLPRLAEENRRLKQEVDQLKAQLYVAQEYRQENQRLKQLLDFQSRVAPVLNMKTVPAAVAGRDPSNWSGMILLSKGLTSGLRAGQAVITPAGLVGRVVAVSQHSAQVLLITDPRSGVGAYLQQSRSPGIVLGEVGAVSSIVMTHIPSDIPVHEGDIALTSGLSGLYPKGIPIGRVLRVSRESSGLFQQATLDTFVDFERLEEVLVVTGYQPVAAPAGALPYPWGAGASTNPGSPGAIGAGEAAGESGDGW